MRARDLIISPQLSQSEVSAYLTSRGFRDPSRADDHLQGIARTVGVPERLADVADLLLDQIADSVDPDAAIRNLESFIETVPSPLNLLALLESDPNSMEVLIGLLSSSPHLSQCLMRNPEYLYWLIEGKRLDRICDRQYFKKEADAQTRPFSDPQRGLDALRRLHRRELLRIGSQDLLGRIHFEATVHQLSDLADVLLQKAYEILAMEKLENLEGFSVLALGKLGGRELNFSSDVDLLFIFARDEDSARVLKFARDYALALGAFTSDGHLYRVDLRLRPMGKGGEIAYSEKACKQYYRTWADTTDRLALIKCRHVAGDATLGKRFVESIQDFVFKRYLDQAAVEEIRWIKRRTDAALRRSRESHTHVKLGLGGIREIEFFAQSFQILYGGIHPELRTPSTLTALQLLVSNGFIKSSEYETLCEAYVFLRDLEHKLQLVHDVQTHSLPQDEEELLRCARRMGYRPVEMESEKQLLQRFFSDLQRHNRGVRRIFHGLFEESESTRGLEEIILNPALEPAEAEKRLESQHWGSPKELLEGIQILRDAPAYPHSPGRIRNLLANLVPHLVSHSQWSLKPRDLFSRFDRFCEALGTRANLYSEVIANQLLRDRLLRLLASGSFLSETLIKNPELLDAIAHSRADSSYGEELDAQLALKPESAQQDVIRVFKRREEFKIALEEVMSPGEHQTRLRLTQLAEACLSAVCNKSVERDPSLEATSFELLALGKLGGKELIFHSDLDLVLLYDETTSSGSAESMARLVKNLRKGLQAYTTAGRAYEIDFRLRPEGRHTAESVPLTQFLRYFEERAEPWERLAYVKARSVYAHGMSIPLADLVYHSPFLPSEVAQLDKIRLRKEREVGNEKRRDSLDLKVGKGALLDIQFVLQLLQVNYNMHDVNSLSALDKLESQSHLDKAQASLLRDGLQFLYALESIHDLLDVKEEGKLSKEPAENQHLAKWLNFESGEQLTEQYIARTHSIREIYRRYFR